MPVVACRHLADELCGKYGIPLLVLHDFDKAGFSIVGTLAGVEHLDKNDNERTTRYEYHYDLDVIDLGLRLSDVKEYSLESESVHSSPIHPTTWKKTVPHRRKSSFVWESRLVCETRPARRVKCLHNANFIRWIETKLQANGIKKVIPDPGILAAAYRRAVQIAVVRDELPASSRRATRWLHRRSFPRASPR